jgi:sortase A
MGRERHSIEDYSIEELEAILARKKREAHATRLQRFRETGRALSIAETAEDVDVELQKGESDGDQKSRINLGNVFRSAFNRMLLWVEILAVFGMAFLFFKGFGLLQVLNREAEQAMALPTSTATPLITAIVLPSGHMPPTSPGGARPNDAEIPENLRPFVQSLPQLPVPTPGPEHARQIRIEALWANPQPVVQGDGWEQLKKGVGQHINGVNPGQPGNLILSAHNDIFGELFRNLNQLKPGDEIRVMTATREYVYLVTGLRIVAPTEVSVMEPTEKPTITLVSCYPYLVDAQRIVVFGELQVQ